MYSFGATLSFAIAHLAVIALRYRKPDDELLFRGRPNLRVGGVDWPIFAVLGALGTRNCVARRSSGKHPRRGMPAWVGSQQASSGT